MEGVAERAVEMVRAGSVIGLGTGRAATAFIQALGRRVRDGLEVRGVPTSEASAKLALELGIPLTSLDETAEIDIDFDGADEVDPSLELIKGYGGAMVREKIVAAASRRLVILVGEEKLVAYLGARGRLPVEVLPFAAAFAHRRLSALGIGPAIRRSASGAGSERTDNGNLILDCSVTRIEDPARLESEICAIPGVVGTGLFVGMAERVLVQRGGGVEELVRKHASG